MSANATETKSEAAGPVTPEPLVLYAQFSMHNVPKERFDALAKVFNITPILYPPEKDRDYAFRSMSVTMGKVELTFYTRDNE